MSKHPNALPDVVARKLSDLAREHGYGIENLTLSWLTKDLGQPATARVSYSTANDVPCEVAQTKERVDDQNCAVVIGDWAVCVGDPVTWDGVENGWVVLDVHPDGMVSIAPLGKNWKLREYTVNAEDLCP